MSDVDLTGYATVVFDCDGVLLDSNRLKTEAFRTVASEVAPALAEELVQHHVRNGGVSRYRKFEYFVDRCRDCGVDPPPVETLCTRFSDQVRAGLLQCAVAEGLDPLRAATRSSTWLVASGGDQQELREVFDARGLARHFDGGIYGSPASKDDILRDVFEQGIARRPTIMLGDSREDYRAATAAGLDFAFVAEWSEFGELTEFAQAHGVPVVRSLAKLLRSPE